MFATMSIQDDDTEPQLPEPAAGIARGFFGAGSSRRSLERAARRMWWGALWAAVLIPLLFWLRFGEVGPLGWGLTLFFIAYCAVTGVGLYFLPRPEYHTPVKLKSATSGRIGAFWLVACTFGPLVGWVATEAFTLTAESWHVLYGFRVFVAGIAPVMTMLPLVRYVRGRSALIAVPLLAGITALPVYSTVNTARDLLEGAHGRLLRYTERMIGME